MVFFGASHMNHMKSYLTNPGVPSEVKNAFSKVRYLAVGGTKWEKCINDIQGINLTIHQAHLGDQWTKFLETGRETDYVVISLGSNDVDSYFTSASKYDDKNQRPLRPVQLRRDLNVKFNSVTPNIREVLLFIEQNITFKQLYYVKIIPRHYWSTGARTLAHWLDFYVVQTLKRRFHVKEIVVKHLFERHYHFENQVMYGMLKTDSIHLNSHGNKALNNAIMRSVLNKWFIQNTTAKLPHPSSKTKKKISNKKARILRLRRLWRQRQRRQADAVGLRPAVSHT